MYGRSVGFNEILDLVEKASALALPNFVRCYVRVGNLVLDYRNTVHSPPDYDAQRRSSRPRAVARVESRSDE